MTILKTKGIKYTEINFHCTERAYKRMDFILFQSPVLISINDATSSRHYFHDHLPVSRAGIHEKSYSQSQSPPYISINSNLVFSCKILHKYMLKLKFESEIEVRNI